MIAGPGRGAWPSGQGGARDHWAVEGLVTSGPGRGP